MTAHATQSAHRVVAGFDGSAASHEALAEAAGRAGSEGRVFVVHGFSAPPGALGEPNATHRLARSAQATEAIAAELEAAECLRGVPWELEAVAQPAAEAITEVARARDAEAIFIGSRGAGRARALLGSVAHDVLHRADRPVLVVTERAARRHVSTATP